MKKRLLCAAILAAVSIPALAQAQTSPAQEPSPNTGAIHFGADLNFTTSYFFRGYNQEDTGLIFQPNIYAWTEFLPDADKSATINSLKLKIGSWNSVQSEQTASDQVWYESDIYGVLTASFGAGFYVNAGYTAYTYPGNAFETVHELGLSAGYDDSSLWTKWGVDGFALHPEIGIYKEVDDGNGSEDCYGEIKITPGFTFDKYDIPGFGPASITFPVVLGISVDDYYLDSDGSNSFFGYIQGGVQASLPITSIPAKYGAWSLTGGVNYIQMLSDSAEAANDGGTEYEVQANVGISMTY